MSEPLPEPIVSHGLTFKRLRSSDDAEFGDLIDLYQEAFPDAERKPTPVLRRMLADDGYYFLLAMEEGRTAGFAIVRALVTEDAALLEYMAVPPASRGRGVGRHLFSAVARTIRISGSTLLVEAESDRVDSPEREARTRRKRFYRSLGARELNDLSWIMPPVIATQPPAMEMLALSYESDCVPKSQLRSWLSGIYVEVYGQRADDPRIEAMLGNLPEEIPLI